MITMITRITRITKIIKTSNLALVLASYGFTCPGQRERKCHIDTDAEDKAEPKILDYQGGQKPQTRNPPIKDIDFFFEKNRLSWHFMLKTWIPSCEPKKMANLRCEPTPHFNRLCPLREAIIIQKRG